MNEKDKFVEDLKEALNGTNMKVATQEELEQLIGTRDEIKKRVDDIQVKHEDRFPVLKNKEFIELNDYLDSEENKDKRLKIRKKFMNFPLEDYETITLKDESLKDEWKLFVNSNKIEAYSYCIVESVIYMGSLLDAKVPPKPAWNDTARTYELTGMMMSFLINNIKKFHPKGEEVREAWNRENNYKGKGTVNPAIVTLQKKE